MVKRAWALVDQESELWALFETRDGAEAYRAAFLESDTGAWFKADLPGWLDAFRIVSFALFESTDTVPVNYRLSYEPMDGPMTRPSEGDRPATEAMRREVERRLTAIYAEFPDRPWRRVDGGALIRPLTEAGRGLLDVDLWMCAPHPALGARPVDLIATDRQARLRALIAAEAKVVSLVPRLRHQARGGVLVSGARPRRRIRVGGHGIGTRTRWAGPGRRYRRHKDELSEVVMNRSAALRSVSRTGPHLI